MRLNPMDLGVCGAVQMLCIGELRFDTPDADTGANLDVMIPANTIVTKAVCVVTEAFDSAATITVGTDATATNLLSNVDGTAADAHQKEVWVDVPAETPVKVILSGTPTVGAAEIYLEVVRRPE